MHVWILTAMVATMFTIFITLAVALISRRGRRRRWSGGGGEGRRSSPPPHPPPPPQPPRHPPPPPTHERERKSEREERGIVEKKYDRWVPHFFINRMLTGLPRVRHVD
jgi:hypothetical protein